MLLSKALETASMHFRNGELYEFNLHLTPERFKKIVNKQRQVVHEYYISPSTPKMMNEESSYLEAIEAILEFMNLKPQLDKLGINYETGLKVK